MKKGIALLLALFLLLSFAACGKSEPGTQNATEAGAAASEAASDASPVKQAAAVIDADSLNWVESALDCYGYKTDGTDCYLSFAHPDTFTAEENDDSGEQYRGYHFNPENPDATANESPYGIYAYFMQGGYGAHKEDFETDAQGGLQERELGGRTVLFGELPADQNTGAHAFVYYTSYSEDEYARIWVILTDPEADGAFRRNFEESVSFVKE